MYLYSLEEAILEAVDGLNALAAERFEKIWDLNEKKIQLKCGEVQRQLEVSLIGSVYTIFHD